MLEMTAGQGDQDSGDVGVIGRLGGFTFRGHDDDKRSLSQVDGELASLVGYQAKDVINNRRVAYGDLIHEDDRPELDKALARARGGQESWRVTYRLKPHRGEPVGVEEHGRLIRDELGEVSGLEGLCIPVAGEVDVAKQMQALVSRLGQTSQEVIDETDYILSVISKLRMLALNARIEAARAGEHGKGFQIVAEEMKQLANDSGEAADRITNTIRDLRGVLADYGQDEAGGQDDSRGGKAGRSGHKQIGGSGQKQLGGSGKSGGGTAGGGKSGGGGR